MRTVLGISLCAVVLFAAAPRALPQTTQQPPTFRDRVDVVRLDVAVVDKGGHPVRGLTAEDFTVLEDGKPARVVGLSEVELPPPTPPTTPWLRDVAPDVVTNDVDARRLIIILFDDAYSGFNFSKTSGVFRDPWILGAGKTIAKQVIDGLRLEAHAEGRRIEIHAFTYYDPANHAAYVYDFDGGIYRLGSDKIDRLNNGTDGVLFIQNPQWAPLI
jgi:hypothetical protein